MSLISYKSFLADSLLSIITSYETEYKEHKSLIICTYVLSIILYDKFCVKYFRQHFLLEISNIFYYFFCMVKFENSLKRKIWASIGAGILILGMNVCGTVITIEEKSIYPVLITALFSIAVLFGLLNTILCYFMYDDEKIVFRSLFKVNTVYFTDVEFFGIGKSTPIMGAGKGASLGGGTGVNNIGRISYYLIKTKDKKFQPDIVVNYENAGLLKEDLTSRIKKVNPGCVVKI